MKKVTVTYDETEWLYAPEEVYTSIDGVERKLQIIFPYRREWEKDTRYPVVLYVPGAAWHRQEMYNDIPKVSKLAECGMVVAMVQHRESELAVFPAPIEDLHRAANYLIENAEKFHIDPAQLFLAGHSSGAHIALMTAFTKANGVWTPKQIGKKDYDIKGVIAQAAPSDLLLCQKEELPPWMKKRPSAELLGVERVEEHLTLARQASCTMYVKDEVALPPVLLLHGDKDDVVSVEHSRNLYQLLKDKKKDVVYYELEGVNHSGNAFWSGEVLEIISDFCFNSPTAQS
ncbi:MAG: alpha/beta hydrolase [Lachnospiraceae bacterium]|nr:alpha/beta hydrolase [Lachnospiraceae bacterium]